MGREMIRLGATREHGFDEPLGLLSDCHRRIERFLDVLIRVTDQAAGRALDEAQRRAVEAALRYFREAAPRHTRDEEDSLFPRLRAAAPNDPRVAAALARVAALEAEHDAADNAHAEIDFWFARWLEQGTLPPPQVRRLAHVAGTLRELYRRHIDVEDRELFPLAAELLDGAQLGAVGREMAERRGLAAPEPVFGVGIARREG